MTFWLSHGSGKILVPPRWLFPPYDRVISSERWNGIILRRHLFQLDTCRTWASQTFTKLEVLRRVSTYGKLHWVTSFITWRSHDMLGMDGLHGHERYCRQSFPCWKRKSWMDVSRAHQASTVKYHPWIPDRMWLWALLRMDICGLAEIIWLC